MDAWHKVKDSQYHHSLQCDQELRGLEVRFDHNYPGADDRSWMHGSLDALEAEMLPIVALLLDRLAPETYQEWIDEQRRA